MRYERPETTDFANVEALNRAFLALVAGPTAAPAGHSLAADEVTTQLGQLTGEQREHLASCPFLVFTLDEGDATRWRRLFDTDETHDLVDAMQRPPDAHARLAAASLGFLWELSRRNPYAVRLVCGASMEWCQQLAASMPICLVQFASNEPCLLTPRFVTRRSVWQKLLAAGTSDDPEIRTAAQVAALQVMLTHDAAESYQPVAAAACKTAVPVMRVAEQTDGSRNG